ncbi:unnamed protein product [Hymenolepis diminuta]|uniref:Uncharacterized protein n=1 Tax=Hymenolepis diminuta TaxID=6216 RepID=A0A0R3SBT7_HYMDI|nr:unnamed protein product [Hymenolepis diminuta]
MRRTRLNGMRPIKWQNLSTLSVALRCFQISQFSCRTPRNRQISHPVEQIPLKKASIYVNCKFKCPVCRICVASGRSELYPTTSSNPFLLYLMVYLIFK